MDVNSRVLEPRGLEKVAKLIERGVRIPNPLTIDIDEAVDIDNISSDGAVSYTHLTLPTICSV